MRLVHVIVISMFLAVPCQAQQKTKVIIDADTANEIDDLYAIVRALIEPSWDVLGLNATQWQASHWAVAHSMEESYRLNSVLNAYMKPVDRVVLKRGSQARLFDWGDKSQTSAASNFIIEQAHNMQDGKLIVVALGALTNIASAILDDPSITSDISLYWLGSRYDFDTDVMSNIDFNSVMDVQALHVILQSDIELHIIPGNVAVNMSLQWQETVNRLQGRHDLLDFLVQRWYNHMDGSRAQRAIWDLSLIEAMIHPEQAEQIQIQTSRERGDRNIWMYKSIDGDMFREDFYATLLDYFSTKDAQ